MANPHPVTTQLMPAWQPGVSGNPAGRPKNKPLITPRIRRFLELPMSELRDLIAKVEGGNVPKDMTAADAIALVMIKKAITEPAWGDGTRDTLLKRVDGEKADIDVEVNVAVGVMLKWDDNTPA